MIPMKTLKMNEDVFEITDSKARESLNFDKSAPQGYILTAANTGNGTQWSPVGLPTDEQTQEAVNAWLDEHPEATTTVQDGSITTAKIANNAVTTPKIADGVVSDEKLVNEYADLYSLRLSDTTETGDMTVIVFSNNKVVVCDTGSPDQDDAIDAFMASKSITHVDILITTHFHTDHTGCFEHVANTYCDENTVFYRCMDWDTSLIPLPSGGLTVFEYESIISALNATSVVPTQNQVVEPWDYCQLRFLNANPLFLAGYYSEESDTTTAAYANASLNNLSLITEVTFLGKTILLTGDVEKKAQNNNASFIGRVDVFKVPHHDWNMNGDYSFFANASPDVAFFNRNTAMTYHGGAPHYWDRIKMHMIGEIPTYQTLNEHVIIHITKSSVNAISGYLYSYKGTVSYSDRRIARSIPYCKSNYNFWSYNTWSIDDVLAMISESDYLEDAFVDMNTTSFMTTFVAQIKEMIGTSFTKYRIVPFKNGFELIPTTNAKIKYVFTSGFEYADSSTYSTHFFVASVDEPDVRRVNVNSGSQQINIKDYAETLSQGVHFRFMYNFTGSDFPYTTGNAWVTFYVTTTNNMAIILNPTADNTKMYKLLKQNSTWGNWHVFNGTQV